MFGVERERHFFFFLLPDRLDYTGRVPSRDFIAARFVANILHWNAIKARPDF